MLIIITQNLSITPKTIKAGSSIQMEFEAKSTSDAQKIKIEYTLPEDSPVLFRLVDIMARCFSTEDVLSTTPKSIKKSAELAAKQGNQNFPALIPIVVRVKSLMQEDLPDQITWASVMVTA